MKILPDKDTLWKLLHYDPVTGKLLWKERPIDKYQDKAWNKKYANREAFTAIDRKGYKVGAIDSVNVRSHRVIWKMVHGVDPEQIDHINGDRLDNRLVNLRNVTGQENQMNMKKPVNNKSGVQGVHWNKQKEKWDAYITHKGVRYNLGRFCTKDEAISVRQQAEKDCGFHENHGR